MSCLQSRTLLQKGFGIQYSKREIAKNGPSAEMEKYLTFYTFPITLDVVYICVLAKQSYRTWCLSCQNIDYHRLP